MTITLTALNRGNRTGDLVKIYEVENGILTLVATTRRGEAFNMNIYGGDSKGHKVYAFEPVHTNGDMYVGQVGLFVSDPPKAD